MASTGTRRQARRTSTRRSATWIKAFLEADPRRPVSSDGQLLAPVKSAFGWHVIQVMYRPTDDAWLKGAQDHRPTAAPTSPPWPGTTPRRETAGQGGDLGWVAKGQLHDRAVRRRSSRRPIGKTSDVVTVTGDGVYLFKVLAEETRTPEGRQLDEIKATAPSRTWYAAKKDAVPITRDPTFSALRVS